MLDYCIQVPGLRSSAVSHHSPSWLPSPLRAAGVLDLPLRVSEFVEEYASTMEIKSTVLFLLLLASCGGWAQEWRFYGANPAGTRFSPLQQIHRENVGSLKRVWTYHTGEVNRTNPTDHHRIAPFETTPLVVNGMLYLSTPSNRVIALD